VPAALAFVVEWVQNMREAHILHPFHYFLRGEAALPSLLNFSLENTYVITGTVEIGPSTRLRSRVYGDVPYSDITIYIMRLVFFLLLFLVIFKNIVDHAHSVPLHRRKQVGIHVHGDSNGTMP